MKIDKTITTKEQIRVVKHYMGVGGTISFIEYMELPTNKSKILSYENFIKRFERIEDGNTRDT